MRHVVLLHGLGRSARSLLLLNRALARRGMTVHAPGYASTRATIAAHAAALAPVILATGPGRLSFVTHSMGGIVLRHMLHAELGNAELRERTERVVMLAPPNGGSQIVDRLSTIVPMHRVNGPAGAELGTGGLGRTLGPIDVPTGVIAGSRSVNPLTSALLPGANDGKVSVAATQLEGMADHIILPVTHTFMMNAPSVVRQTIAFLENGRFRRS